MKHVFSILFLLTSSSFAFSDASISPSLFFMRQAPVQRTVKISQSPAQTASVTIKFSLPPEIKLLEDLENHGVRFKRDNGVILHSLHIYPAVINLDSLSSIARFPEIEKIEDCYRPAASSTLNVSNPQVQASKVWYSVPNTTIIDGGGVTIADIDTGIDIFHPGFFKPDAGSYQWIDVNHSGAFESGIDCVDLNGNGLSDPGENLRFYDASFSDPLQIMERTTGVYDADIDWLYNDANNNGVRDYGPSAGFGETSPSFGERLFIIQDTNNNNRLDPGDNLIGLGTSKIAAIFDKNGKHLRGKNLLSTTGDLSNHGTGACGIAGGQVPGRRLTGMAPGADFIMINRLEVDVVEGVLWAKGIGAKIFMYEYGSWVFEPLDGSSNVETLISDLYQSGCHQFTASGNLAGPTRKKHSAFTLPGGSQDSLVFRVPDYNITEVYISIIWRGSTPRPVISYKFNGSFIDITGDMVKHTVGKITVLSGYEYSSRGTSRMDILISSDVKITGNPSLLFTNNSKKDIFIHGYIADNVTQWVDGAQFTNYVTDNGTVCSPGTALKGITVGAYDPRGTRNIQGDINDFSSWGKTVDGRRAVSITAPGDIVYSLTSHYNTNNPPGGYLNFGGTSAALPHVAGCAALLAQAKPGISPDDLGKALLNYALKDNFTGPVPNDIWGYGKLRIYDSFHGLNMVPVAIETSRPSAFSVSEGYPNPFNSTVNFSMTLPQTSSVDISIYNILGQRVNKFVLTNRSGYSTFSWDGKNELGKTVSSGLYVLDFSCAGQSKIKKVVYMK
ncbi:MAG: S8 family serine peptidase [Candidatus Latescibacter sp.]|nr:S8 family serine peptidase [Candidatus Latescibacter sp.]